MARSPLAIIFITVFIDLLGFGIVIPFLPLYAESLGGSPFVAALLGTAYAAMQFVFSPIWGRLSDRIGRRPVIIGTLLANTGAYLLLGMVGSVVGLFVARLLAGIASGNIPTAQAYIADSTPPDKRAKGMGMIGAAFGLGFVLGPAISAMLLWRWHDPALPSLITAGLCAANCIWAYFRLPETLKPGSRAETVTPLGRLQRIARGLHVPGLAPLFVLLFVIRFAFAALEWTFPIFLKQQFDFSFTQVGMLLAYTGVLMALTQGVLVGRLVPAIGERAMVAVGTLVMAGGFALVPFSPNIAGLLVLCAVLAVGAGLSNPSLTSLISQAGAADTQGGLLGVGQSLSSLAMILGPAWGGFSFDHFSVWVPYTSSGILMAVACVVSVKTVRGRSRAAST